MSKQKYLELARNWHQTGRTAIRLMTGEYQLTALRCWVGGLPAGAADPELALIRAFAVASVQQANQQNPRWYESFLATRSSCGQCGESYRVENLSICTVCSAEVCPNCKTQAHPRTGRYAHYCGGDLVG
jgi:hypothetical protein